MCIGHSFNKDKLNFMFVYRKKLKFIIQCQRKVKKGKIRESAIQFLKLYLAITNSLFYLILGF